MAATHDKEKQLTREIAPKVESALPGTEVLAVELTSPERFTVFVDHIQGVDHAVPARDQRAAGLPQRLLRRCVLAWPRAACPQA
jgi:hypothetical protein